MDANTWTQFRMLLWKNYLHQKRQKIMAVLELVLPTIFAIVIVILRSTFSAQAFPDGQVLIPFQPDKVLFWPNIIAYAPNTSVNTAIMTRTASLLRACNITDSNPTCQAANPYQPVIAIGFETEDDMVTTLIKEFQTKKQMTIDSQFIGGVVFVGDIQYASDLTDVKYKIRLSATSRNQGANQSDQYSLNQVVGWETDQVFPSQSDTGPRAAGDPFGGQPGYMTEGFLPLQYGVDAAIIEFLSNKSLFDNAYVGLWRYDYPPYVFDQFIAVIQTQLPLVLMLGYMIVVLNVTRNIVLEKEKRLKEFMKIMGLHNWLHFAAHFVWNFFYLLLTSILLCICFSAKFGHVQVMSASDGSVIFLFLLVYNIAAICYCFAVGAFFTKGNTAAAFSGVLWFVLYLPYFFVQTNYTEMTMSQKMASCLIINTAMGLGSQVIGEFESKGDGIQWRYLNQSANVNDPFTLGHVLLMLLIDSAVCLLIAWYVEAVRPGDDGLPLPWHFPFTKSYWCANSMKDTGAARRRGESLCETGMTENDLSYFEADPQDLEAVLCVKGLTKVFKKKTAVDNLRLNMYHGQITALLGHNGAGKSTTMAMLTGLIPPSAGTAYINGLDITTSMPEVRKSLGLCPQYNILFDNLTVTEQLIFFAKLKGAQNVKLEAEQLLHTLHMTDKANSLACHLSGGMKRKLSVGIALIGGSRVIMLDEPTAGMDPSARRSTWDLLQREREGRSILLTTHYMEEADLLGDRIAIMAAGKVQCCGSPLFLKNRYGAGYRLSVVFLPGHLDKVMLLTQLIQSHVARARIDAQAGLEVTYLLPQDEVEHFQEMFRQLEANQIMLGISSYGASVTTMEEVFLRVGEETDKQQGLENAQETAKKKVAKKNDAKVPATASNKSTDSASDDGTIETGGGLQLHEPLRNSGYSLLVQQFCAMFIKRMLHTARNWKILYPQLLLPVVNMCLCLAFNLSLPTAGTSKPLTMDLTPFYAFTKPEISYMYKYDTVPGNDFNSAKVAQQFAQQYKPQVDSNQVELTNLNTYWNTTNWRLTYVSADPEDFGVNSTGMQSYELVTANTSIESFNIKNMISGYFQQGNVLTDWIDQMYWKLKHDDLSPGQRANLSNALANHEKQFCQVNSKCHDDLQFSAVAMFNDQPFHTPGIALNSLDNALLKYFAGSQYSLVTINEPLPPTDRDQIAEFRNMQVQSFTISFTVVLSMAFVSGTFIIFVVKERVGGSKHLQFVCGVHAVNFWISAFAWDFVNFVIPCLLQIPAYYAYGVHAFTDNGRVWDIASLFVLYCAATLPYAYVISFAFDHPTTGFVKFTMANILTGPGFVLVIGIMEIPQLHLTSIHDILHWIFMILSPNYCLGQALRTYSDNYLSMSVCTAFPPQYCHVAPGSPCCSDCTGSLCISYTNDYTEWTKPGIGQMYFFLIVHLFVHWMFLLLWELGYLRVLEYSLRTRDKVKSMDIFADIGGGGERYAHLDETRSMNSGSVSTISTATPSSTATDSFIFDDSATINDNYIDDADVSVEQTKVETTPMAELTKTGIVIMERLSKRYSNNFLAVRSLSLCVERGECFGLLGVNGAGKTTTFKMLTGDVEASEGNAYINGFSVNTQIRKAQRNLGYCPQFDANIDQMTGVETLRMYARLRGVKEAEIQPLAQQLIDMLGLTPHKNKMVGAYSGGNKRKLSIAVALMGNPSVVLLDEPTAGIDPVARRLVWHVLTKVRQAGTPLILTSHSMEECEALCTRLAIMVGGRFKCLGSPQHLKAKFGSGYTVLIKVEKLRFVNRAMHMIKNTFSNSFVKDVHQRQIHFHINSQEVPWSSIFGQIELLKPKLHIVDYSVCQTSLEQIFLNFSREQEQLENEREALKQ